MMRSYTYVVVVVCLIATLCGHVEAYKPEREENIIIKDIEHASEILNLNLDNDTLEKQVLTNLTNLRIKMTQTMAELTKARDRYKDVLNVYKKFKGAHKDLPALCSSVAWNSNKDNTIGFTVVLAMVTSAYVPLAKNFLCYIRTIPDPPNVLLWAIDDAAFEELKDWGSGVVKFDASFAHVEGEHAINRTHNMHLPFEPESKEFNRILLARNRIALEILNTGYHVLITDIDQVWLHNPLTKITTTDYIQGIKASDSEQISSGMLFLPSTEGVRDVWKSFVAVQEEVVTKERTFEKYFEQHLLNIHLGERFGKNTTFLPRHLFLDGKSFFLDSRLATKLQPIVVHADIMGGLINKRNLFRRKTLWIINDATQTCPILDELAKSQLTLSPEETYHLKPQITIKVITFNRPDSLLRCLNALRNAYYDGNIVDLHVEIDFDPNESNFPPNSLINAENFRWPHGKKEIHYRVSHAHVKQQWIESWYPSVDSLHSEKVEFAFVVEDDVEVSMYYFRWLLKAVHAYYSPTVESSRLMGITLQKTWLNLASHPAYFPDIPRNTSILYQVPGTWGTLLAPTQWRTFRQWYELQLRKNALLANQTQEGHVLQPYIPGNLITNNWIRVSKNKMLLPWLLKFMYEMGYYFLYPNLPNRSLVINHQEIGVYNEEKMSPDSLLIMNENDIPAGERDFFNMEHLNTLPLYDLCAQLSTPDKLLEAARSKSPVVCMPPHSTNATQSAEEPSWSPTQ